MEQESLDPPDFPSLQASVWNDAVNQLGPNGEHPDRINTEITTLKEELADEQAEHQRILERAEESLRVAVRKRFPNANSAEHETFVDWVIKFLGRLGPSSVEKSMEPPRLWQEVQHPEKWRAFARHFTGRKRSISRVEFRLAVYKAIRKVRSHSIEVTKLPDPKKLRAQALQILFGGDPDVQQQQAPADPLEERAAKIPYDTLKNDYQLEQAETLVKAHDDNWSSITRMRDLAAAAGKNGSNLIKRIQAILREAEVSYEDRNPQDFIWVLRVVIKKYKVAQGYIKEE